MFKRAINNHNLHHSSINTSASFYCMVVIRAKVTDENEVTPQSDYVIIYHNGNVSELVLCFTRYVRLKGFKQQT